MNESRVKRRRDDVLGAEFQLHPVVGCGHFVWNILSRQRRQRIGAGDFHVQIDAPRSHVQRASENVWKPQDIVDLIGVVRASCGDHGIGAHGVNLLRGDLGIRIGHREDDRLVRHGLHHGLRHRALRGKAQEHVGALHGVGQRSRVSVHCVRRLPLVHALFAAAIDHAGVVDCDAVVGPDAHGLYQLKGSDAGGAGAAEHELDVLEASAGDRAGVDQAGGGDDRGSVLVVVEDRDVEELLKLRLDTEALRALDVLEIDARRRSRRYS